MSNSNADSHRLALPAGTTLAEYRLLGVLGKGGFGLTYLAEDTSLGIKVAIKELLPDGVATRVGGSTVVAQSQDLDETYRWALQRFEQEAQLLAGLSHPNIVRVIRLIIGNGTAYMVMEYVEGQSLKDRIRTHGPLDEATARSILSALMSGLEYVHGRSFFHRDVKPDNVFIATDGRPVLLDFGSARQNLGQSVSMTAIVSKGYSPFEQYQTHGKQGPWTDIYALAGTMIYTITGTSPPDATDRFEREEPDGWLAQSLGAKYSRGFIEGLECGFRVRAANRPSCMSEWRTILSGREPSQSIAQTRVATEPAAPVAASATLVRDSTPSAETLRRTLAPVEPRLRADLFRWAVAASALLGMVGIVVWLLLPSDSSTAPLSPSVIKEDDGRTPATDQREGNSAPPRDNVPPEAPASANTNLAEAEDLYNRANQLYDSKGGPEAYGQAFRLYQQAASMGLTKAYGPIGRAYITGNGVSQNYAAAARELTKAALENDSIAENCLGVMHEYGHGDYDPDPKEALKWYRKAAMQGLVLAQFNVGRLFQDGIGTDKKDQTAALVWYRKAAEKGHPASQYCLGMAYLNGQGVRSDVEEAKKWLRLAAEQGDGYAQYNLGVAYYSNGGPGSDPSEALKWLKLGAAQGIEEARQNVRLLEGNLSNAETGAKPFLR